MVVCTATKFLIRVRQVHMLVSSLRGFPPGTPDRLLHPHRALHRINRSAWKHVYFSPAAAVNTPRSLRKAQTCSFDFTDARNKMIHSCCHGANMLLYSPASPKHQIQTCYSSAGWSHTDRLTRRPVHRFLTHGCNRSCFIFYLCRKCRRKATESKILQQQWINKNNKNHKAKKALSIIIQLIKSDSLQQQCHKQPAEKEPFASGSEALSVCGSLSRLMQSVKCGAGRGRTGQFSLDCWNRRVRRACSDNREQMVAGECWSGLVWYTQVKQGIKMLNYQLFFCVLSCSQHWVTPLNLAFIPDTYTRLHFSSFSPARKIGYSFSFGLQLFIIAAIKCLIHRLWACFTSVPQH